MGLPRARRLWPGVRDRGGGIGSVDPQSRTPGGGSRPRRRRGRVKKGGYCHVDGGYYLLTCRVLLRRYLFEPDWDLIDAFEWALGVYAKEHGIRSFAVCVMSTHYHLVVLDTRGLVPKFLRDVNRSIANAIEARYRTRRRLRAGAEQGEASRSEGRSRLDRVRACEPGGRPCRPQPARVGRGSGRGFPSWAARWSEESGPSTTSAGARRCRRTLRSRWTRRPSSSTPAAMRARRRHSPERSRRRSPRPARRFVRRAGTPRRQARDERQSLRAGRCL